MKSKGGCTSIRCICKQLCKVIIKFDTSAQLSGCTEWSSYHHMDPCDISYLEFLLNFAY